MPYKESDLIWLHRFMGMAFLGALFGCGGAGARRSTGVYIDDTLIASKIRFALARDALTRVARIRVDTCRGMVRLTGTVDTADVRNRIDEIARGTEGVRGVRNALTLR